MVGESQCRARLTRSSNICLAGHWKWYAVVSIHAGVRVARVVYVAVVNQAPIRVVKEFVEHRLQGLTLTLTLTRTPWRELKQGRQERRTPQVTLKG